MRFLSPSHRPASEGRLCGLGDSMPFKRLRLSTGQTKRFRGFCASSRNCFSLEAHLKLLLNGKGPRAAKLWAHKEEDRLIHDTNNRLFEVVIEPTPENRNGASAERG